MGNILYKPSEIYCGNNAQDSSLVSGTKRLGNRRECFRIGIGTGLHLPYDPKYAGNYQPINTDTIYCGTGVNLPVQHSRFGTAPQCLQKGVAVGKRIKAEKGFPYLKYISLVIVYVIIFLALFETKLDWFVIKNSEGVIVDTNWVNLLGVYIPVVIVMYLGFYKFVM